MIRIENIHKSYGEKILLNGASYHFPEGEKVALIGENGTGKSTLLNIITGLESLDEGQVLIPGRTSPGFLPQEPNPNPEDTVSAECEAGAVRLRELDTKMQELLVTLETDSSPKTIAAYETTESEFRSKGGYELASRAASILAGLGFSDDQLRQSPKELSGGWRMRLELARIFLNQPDFLVLDEPTNHLDLPSLVWVESWLKTFKGTLLFVSHDKALLNRLSTLTLHLHRGQLTPYKGNFNAFLEARALREEQEIAERAQIQAKKGDLERFVQRFGAKASKAKQAKSKMKQIEKLEIAEKSISVTQGESNLTFKLPEPLKSSRILYQVDKGSIGYDKALSQGIHLQVEKGHKIAIIGANGIGKSTLLKTITGQIPSLQGDFKLSPGTRIARFAQDQAETLDAGRSILDNVLSQSDMGEKEARGLLGGFLFTGDDVFKEVRVLSGGEKSRVGLACVLARPSNFLLLDEPTNHLDMKSISRLIQSLQAYQGTLAFVSHDREFIDDVCTHIFAMLPDGRSMLFEGDLSDYARLAEVAGFPNVLLSHQEELKPSGAPDTITEVSEAKDSQVSEQDFKELKKRKQKLEKDIQGFDQKILSQKKCRQKIDADMISCSTGDYQELARLQKEQSEIDRTLEDLEEKWLTAQEELEQVLSKGEKSGRSF